MINAENRPRRYSRLRVLRTNRGSDAFVTTPPSPPGAPAGKRGSGSEQLCVCGHPKIAHEHYRPGTDCSLCPLGVCERFRRQR